jgi:hypothetical protein
VRKAKVERWDLRWYRGGMLYLQYVYSSVSLWFGTVQLQTASVSSGRIALPEARPWVVRCKLISGLDNISRLQ